MEEEPTAEAEAGAEAKPEAAAEGGVDGTAQEADEVGMLTSYAYSHELICTFWFFVDGVCPERATQCL